MRGISVDPKVEAMVAVPQGPFVMALDQGTTNTKALLVDVRSGAVVRAGSRRVRIEFPGPGMVEQSADDIWESTLGAIADCLTGVAPSDLAAISISNQRESVALWGADGAVRGPVLGWQDARTSEACAKLASAADMIAARTGLGLDAMYSAPKMRWLIDNVGAPDARVGTIDTYLVYRLTGNFLAEAGNASRTMLCNLDTLDWDSELAALFGVPTSALAPIVPSNGGFGVTRAVGPIPSGIPVVSVLADSHAALYFHTEGRPGEGKATYGTGSSVMVNAPRSAPAAPGIATTLAWLTNEPAFAQEGNVLASGAALMWAAALLTDGDVAALGALAQATAPTGVSFVPAFSGLGAPYFDRTATGLIAGIGASTGRGDLARAAFEAVAHQVADVSEAMGLSGEGHRLYADGGATASGFLMQRQADLLGHAVRVSAVAEASALGAAMVAVHKEDPGIEWSRDGEDRVPSSDHATRKSERANWRRAVARSRGLAVSLSDSEEE